MRAFRGLQDLRILSVEKHPKIPGLDNLNSIEIYTCTYD